MGRHGSRDEGCPQACHEGSYEGQESQHHRTRQACESSSLQGQEGEDSWRTDEGDLDQEQAGKIVSKAASARAKKNWATSALKKWIDALKQARKELKIQGFCAVNGKAAQGKALYAKTRAILGK